MGKIVSNESEDRSTIQRFQAEPPRGNVRSVMPFGFASKAPAGTQAFVVPAGNDPSNQNILGHFDEKKRPPLQDGDTAIYDAHGNVIYLSNGKMQFGSEAADENMVLGKVFKQLMSDLLQELAIHTHIGNLGYETAPPSDAAEFTALKSSPVDDEKVLSDVAFTEKS